MERQKLAAVDRPANLYKYVVLGFGVCPLDMLRYDAAWPVRSEDAIAITSQSKAAKAICLASHHPPTAARWESFGWTVR